MVSAPQGAGNEPPQGAGTVTVEGALPAPGVGKAPRHQGEGTEAQKAV